MSIKDNSPIDKDLKKAKAFDNVAVGAQKQKELKLDEQGRIKVDKHKPINIDHAGLANMILKYINVIPGVPLKSKAVMNAKITNPGITNFGVAMLLGMREFEIPLYERDGIERVKQFIAKISMQDGVNKFNVERAVQAEIKRLKQKDENSLDLATS